MKDATVIFKGEKGRALAERLLPTDTDEFATSDSADNVSRARAVDYLAHYLGTHDNPNLAVYDRYIIMHAHSGTKMIEW